MLDIAEKREHERYPYTALIQYTSGKAGNYQTVRIANFSAGGIMMVSESALLTGLDIDVNITDNLPPIFKPCPAKIYKAKVKWCAEDTDNDHSIYSIGIQFSESVIETDKTLINQPDQKASAKEIEAILKKCPKCQYNNSEEAKYCNQCAYDLSKNVDVHSSAYIEPKSYTPKFLAEKILKSKNAIVGERKLVTVLFADVANYTAMSGKLDPEDVHKIMDGCFEILMDRIHAHNGTINQFTGDGVMALFGAPLALEDHAQNACHAALAIQNAAKKYGKELEEKYNVSFQMRIGINSGSVVVGAIGDDLRMDYTAIGDTTNLAARMESKATPGNVLVSPSTYKKVYQQFEFKSLGEVEVKGKEKPLKVYELIKEKIYRQRLGAERKIYSEMIGRDDDLSRIALQVNKVVNGEGSVVNVIGEAGIGKSRLIAELKKRDVMKHLAIFEGRAISIGRNLSFHPIIDLLKEWARIKENDSEFVSLRKLELAIRNLCREESNEVIPFVATLMGMKLSGRHAERIKNIDGEGLEKLILKSVKDVMSKTSDVRPLVIVIEDLHWADTSSIDFLESLFLLAENKRILFINVFRPDHRETGERIVKTLREKLPVYYVEINLQPLTNPMAEQLIDNMLEIKGLQYRVKNKILQRAGGNPFFIEEVVRSFIDEGAVVVRNGKFEVTDKIEAMVIPYTINDVLMDRIDRLEEETRNLIKVASVIGRNFFHRILTEVAKAVGDIDDRLSYLKEIQLIRERKWMDELNYLFKHALAQEAAYESILQEKRKELHLQVARSIAKVFNDRLHEFYGMLAFHHSKAEDYENAEHFLVKAGEEAIRSSASIEALNFYQEGLKLYLQNSKGAKDPEKLAMFEKNMAIACYNKSRWVEAVQHIDNVFGYWNIPTSPNRKLTIIKFMQNALWIMTGLNRIFLKFKPAPTQRDVEGLKLYLKKVMALAGYDHLGFFYFTFSGFNRCLEFDYTKSADCEDVYANGFIGTSCTLTVSGLSGILSDRLLKIGRSLMDKDNTQNLIAYKLKVVTAQLYRGDWGAIGAFEASLVVDAIKTGDLWNVTQYLYEFSWAKIEMGDFEAAELSLMKLSEIASDYDYRHAASCAAILRTQLALKKNSLFEAKVEAERGISLANHQSVELLRLILLGFCAEIHVLLNDLDGAEKVILQADKIVKNHKLIATAFIAPYRMANFIKDIEALKASLDAKEKFSISDLKKKAYFRGKAAVERAKKLAPNQTKTFLLMGDYYWIIRKQRRAFKWWGIAIKRGEELGARPDLSRTYFGVAKALLHPKCKYKRWESMTAQEYLKKTRTLFQEMDLQYDIDELDKIVGSEKFDF